MADKKISQLTALSAANVASATDVLAIVDTSATETKKITAKDLIDGALNGGTANGVLYLNGSKVATSGATFAFDSSDRLIVGAGSAVFGARIECVANTSGEGLRIRGRASDATGVLSFGANAAATEYARIQSDNTSVLIFGTGASGTERMRLTSSVLSTDSSISVGIGTASPAQKLHVASAGNNYIVSQRTGASTSALLLGAESGGTSIYSWTTVAGSTGVPLNFYTGASPAMTLDASGNLLVGTTSVGGKLTVDSGSSGLYGYFNSTNANGGYLSFVSSGTVHGDIGTAAQVVSGGSTNFGINARGSRALIFGTNENERGRFSADGTFRVKGAGTAGSTDAFQVSGSAPADAARITSGGTLLVGCTATPSASVKGFGIEFDADGPTVLMATAGTGSDRAIGFYNPNGLVGDIVTNGSATAYNTSSDRRLKENIAPAQDTGAIIDAVQVVQHDWKVGGHVRYGFVAQDLHEVMPEAVTAGDDGDEIERNWGVDYSKLVPMLVKEIQSLRSRVAALEAK